MENCTCGCAGLHTFGEIYVAGLMLGIILSPIITGIRSYKEGYFEFDVLGLGLLISLAWPIVAFFGSLYWAGYGLAKLYNRCKDIVDGLISKAQEEEENEG